MVDVTVIAMNDTGEGITRPQVVKEYMIAHTKSFKETTILSAWKKCGILPFDPGRFMAKDFGPSIPTLFSPPYPTHFQCHPMAATQSHQMMTLLVRRILTWMMSLMAQKLGEGESMVMMCWSEKERSVWWIQGGVPIRGNCPFWLSC